MIMSLLGSGLFLVGICMLYDLTGHLLMSNIQAEIGRIVAEGAYRPPLLVTIAIISVGLAIKSALFPFHAWLPDAYGYSTVSSPFCPAWYPRDTYFCCLKLFTEL